MQALVHHANGAMLPKCVSAQQSPQLQQLQLHLRPVIQSPRQTNVVIHSGSHSPCSHSRVCKVAASPAPSSTDDHADMDEQQELQTTAFGELGIDAALLPGLASLQITNPSPIQAAAIPRVLSGSNVAVQSYTGSGKTLSYLLPVLTMTLKRGQEIYQSNNGREVPLQALIVAPSQELAMQVVRVAQAVLPVQGRSLVQQCIGGANPKNQQAALERNKPLVVVGTPGRLSEFIRTGVLRVHQTPLLVLDEADQLMAPQFAEDMSTITSHTGKKLGPAKNQRPSTDSFLTPSQEGSSSPSKPDTRQTVLVSATLSKTVLAMTDKWCPSPEYVAAGGPAPTLAPVQPQAAAAAGDTDPEAPGWGWGVKGWDGPASDLGPKGVGSAGGVEGEGLVPSMPPHLKHYVMAVEGQHKVDTLRRALHALNVQRALVFMNFQQRLKDVKFKLEARSLQVEVLHGEMPKVARQNVLNNFRRGKLQALVVSDIVARGLDVPDCDAVFHLELPSSAAHYAHRAGRTGRMGKPGSVISLVKPSEMWIVRKLADRLGVEIQEVHVSNGQLQVGSLPRRDRRSKSEDRENEGEEDKVNMTQSVAAAGTQAIASSQRSQPQSQPADPTQAVKTSSKPHDNKKPARLQKKDETAGVPKGAKVVKDDRGEYEMVIYDEEDEVEMGLDDENEMEKELEQLRRPAGKHRRASRGLDNHKGPASSRGSNGSRQSGRGIQIQGQKGGEQIDTKKHLSLELEELKAEKARLRQQRYAERQKAQEQ